MGSTLTIDENLRRHVCDTQDLESSMKLVLRLLGYMRPYVLYWVLSVLLMAVVGALAAFRILLIKPIINNVLSVASSPDKVLNFVIPRTHLHVDLQVLI